jgi:hypothetical protein
MSHTLVSIIVAILPLVLLKARGDSLEVGARLVLGAETPIP